MLANEAIETVSMKTKSENMSLCRTTPFMPVRARSTRLPKCRRARSWLIMAWPTSTEAKVTMVPDTSVKIEGKPAETLMKLISALEDLDDVQRVTANFDIPEDVYAEVAG